MITLLLTTIAASGTTEPTFRPLLMGRISRLVNMNGDDPRGERNQA